MILNNTQANIFKVNGGIADNFANRPTANGSFYIFYSLDTQEIFYDSGTWVLIGSGNIPTSTNIYNSDGTLTANRTLSGGNNDLNFSNLNIFKTISQGNDIGLKLDFANALYSFGQNDAGILADVNNQQTIIGDFNNFNNLLKLIVDDLNSYIKTSFLGNDIGLKLDFANQQYNLGTNSNFVRISETTNAIDIQGLVVPIGDVFSLGNQTIFAVDDTNQLIKTSNQGNDIGLKLDFANDYYLFGQIIGAYQNLTIDALNFYTYFSYNGLPNGLQLNYANNTFDFGRFNSGNGTYFSVDDTNQIIKTINQANNIGLNLDFANEDYIFGDLNKAFINIQNFSSINAISLISNATVFFTQQPGSPTTIRNQIISLTAYTGVNNVILTIDSQSRFAAFFYQNQTQGLDLAFQNSIYSIGQLTGGNTTKLTIDDGATYPIQFDGTNVLSTTSGGTSGQHLKVKINGLNYKIKLENP